MLMGFGYQLFIVENPAVGGWVLNYESENACPTGNRLRLVDLNDFNSKR